MCVENIGWNLFVLTVLFPFWQIESVHIDNKLQPYLKLLRMVFSRQSKIWLLFRWITITNFVLNFKFHWILRLGLNIATLKKSYKSSYFILFRIKVHKLILVFNATANFVVMTLRIMFAKKLTFNHFQLVCYRQDISTLVPNHKRLSSLWSDLFKIHRRKSLS